VSADTIEAFLSGKKTKPARARSVAASPRTKAKAAKRRPAPRPLLASSALLGQS
jgi:hypothetical protein